MIRAYKYRLYPTPEQQEKLDRWMGMCRFVYNLALETKKAAWESGEKNLTSFDLMKQLTELKHTECPWLAECSGQSLESAITNLDKAYASFFRGNGFPKFKKRSGKQTITFRRYCAVKPGQVNLTKLGSVNFLEHRPIGKGEIRTITVSKTPCKEYFISILVKDEKTMPQKPAVKEERAIGVDMGLKTFLALSDGHTIPNNKYLHRQQKRLRRGQRTLARRHRKGVPVKDQSKGYHKQKLAVATMHKKIANQREDFLHKTSTVIIKQFDTICLESLNVVGMMKNKRLSKAIADVSWGRFNDILQYKADWYGKNLIRIGTFEPSSKMCSDCGHIFKEMTLANREWDCDNCGSRHDRDLNAAINIKNLGLRQVLHPLTKPNMASVLVENKMPPQTPNP